MSSSVGKQHTQLTLINEQYIHSMRTEEPNPVFTIYISGSTAKFLFSGFVLREPVFSFGNQLLILVTITNKFM